MPYRNAPLQDLSMHEHPQPSPPVHPDVDRESHPRTAGLVREAVRVRSTGSRPRSRRESIS